MFIRYDVRRNLKGGYRFLIDRGRLLIDRGRLLIGWGRLLID